MRIHYLQHVPFEDPANVFLWGKTKNASFSKTLLFEKPEFPELDSFDLLLVMGGPMNIYEEDKYSWLTSEKEFIQKVIKAKKLVFGICLGTQLIADVLGGKVSKGKETEIGWFPVRLTEEGKSSELLTDVPEEFLGFHWHGDTFEIPVGAKRLMETKGCRNQAFLFDDHVLGLQFHLESSQESIAKLVENCSDEIVSGKYIQDKETILDASAKEKEIYPLLEKLLNRFVSFQKSHSL